MTITPSPQHFTSKLSWLEPSELFCLGRHWEETKQQLPNAKHSLKVTIIDVVDNMNKILVYNFLYSYIKYFALHSKREALYCL